MSKLTNIVKTTKKAADSAKDAVATASKTRLELGKRGKAKQVSEQVQKRFNKIQAELKYLVENKGSTESIAKRRQSLKDMESTHLIKRKPMKEIDSRIPDEMVSDVRAANKDKARKKSYYARHDAQGKPTTKLSAKYWSHKVKW